MSLPWSTVVGVGKALDTAPLQPGIDEIELPLIEATFCVIDLETTGTSPDSRITEIGAVKASGGEILGTFQTLVNPGVAIPGFITALTGITNSAVAGAPRLREVFPSLIEFCRGSIMVAHNARFDMGFILRAAEALGYDWPARQVLDTLTLARRIIPRSEVRDFRLSSLAENFATSVSPNHRGLDDACATLDVFHALVERVGNQGIHTVMDLLDYTHTVSKTRHSRRTWAEALPQGPGVYFFVREAERGRQYLYVGTSRNIRRRVASYFTASETRGRMEEMVLLATGVEAIECRSALEAAVVELRLITAHQPPYNRRSKQPRNTWIKTTIEPIPRLSVVRQVKDDSAAYCGPFAGSAQAGEAVLALLGALPVRRCVDRLSTTTARQPCALAEIASCPAPCTLSNLDSYREIIERVKICLAGDIRGVREACLTEISGLSSHYRYEEAAEVLERFRILAHGMHRQVRLNSLAACPQIVAARPVESAWEIHVIRYAQLAGAAVAWPGEDPLAVAELAVTGARTVEPGRAGRPAGSIEEAELIAAWLEKPGVRLMDVDGTWAWPVHGFAEL